MVTMNLYCSVLFVGVVWLSSIQETQQQQYTGPVPPRPFFSNAVPATTPSRQPQQQPTQTRSRTSSGRGLQPPPPQQQVQPRLIQSSQQQQPGQQTIRLRRPSQQPQQQQQQPPVRARIPQPTYPTFDQQRNTISDDDGLPQQYVKQQITGPTPVPNFSSKPAHTPPVKALTPRPVVEDDYSKDEEEYEDEDDAPAAAPSPTTPGPSSSPARLLSPTQPSPVAPVQFTRPQSFQQPAGFRPSPQYRPEAIKSVFPIDSLQFQSRQPTPRPAPVQLKPQPTPQPLPQQRIQQLQFDSEEEEEELEDEEPQYIQKKPQQRIQLVQQRPIQQQIRQQPQQQPIRQQQPLQQPIRQQQPQPQQQIRQQTQQQPIRQQSLIDYQRPQVPKQQGKVSQVQKERKPVVQIIRKYQEENEDGSITWGYENDDGSFKEETIGVDCVTRGKYGYVDPDGVRREYTYSTGIPCDKEQEEAEAAASANEGYIDYTNNKYVLPNGDEIDLEAMVKNRARKPVSKYRN